MIFTHGDINKIKKTQMAQKLELTSGSFYSKEAFDQNIESLNLACNELIYTNMAKMVGLICPEVYLVMPSIYSVSEIFIVSEDLACFGSFQTMEELGLSRTSSSSLEEIEQFLITKYAHTTYENQIPSLFLEIIKLYFLDIFMDFWDRLPRNFGILETDHTLCLAVLDNEYAFTNFIHNISASKSGNSWWQQRKALNNLTDINLYNEKRWEMLRSDLLNFWTGPYQKYISLFDEMYQLFTPSFLENIITKIEKDNYIYSRDKNINLEIPDKDVILSDYAQKYAVLTEIKRSLNNGRK